MGSGDYENLPKMDLHKVLKLDDGPGVKGRNYQQEERLRLSVERRMPVEMCGRMATVNVGGVRICGRRATI